MVPAVAFGVVVLAVGVLVAAMARTTVDRDDVAWIAHPLAPDTQEGSVLARYLERHRGHRMVGGFLGVVLACAAGVRLYGQVNIGIGRQSPIADVLFCGLAGTIAGAFSAETFRLSEPRSAVVSATLDARAPLGHRQLVTAARALTVVAVIAGTAVLALDGDAAPVAIAGVGALLATVAEATRRAISGRRRPVLSDRARFVDARMRWFANGAVSHLQLAAALLVLGWVAATAPPADNGALELLQIVAVLGCLVGCIVFLRRAAPRPPRSWSAAS